MENSKFSKTKIESIGSYLPPKAVTTKQILADCVNELRIPMERVTGIKERRMAGEVEFSVDLAIKAVENCFANSKYKPEDIDFVVCCNISSYDEYKRVTFEPTTTVKVCEHFGMTNTINYDISNACAGFFTGINLAESYLKSGAANRCLVISGEYITHLTDTAQKEIVDMHDTRLACLTLGDSGVALILERSEEENVGFDDMEMVTLGKYSPFCIAKSSEFKHGGAIMYTQSKNLHDVATVEGAASVCAMANEYGPEKIDVFMCHQTSRISIWNGIRMVNKGLKDGFRGYFNRDNVIENLAQRGNTSTTTHMLAVMDYIKTDRLHSHKTMMFSINASGLTIGSAIYRFDDLPDRIRNNHVLGTTTPKIEKVVDAPYAIETPRVMMDVLEITPSDVERTTFPMCNTVGKMVIDKAGIQPNDIDLLIFCGIYRDEFLVEPAIAAMIAGDLEVRSAHFNYRKNALAFDIKNGGMSFLSSCHAAQTMIQGGKSTQALVLASEVENNKVDFPDEVIGIEETAAGAIFRPSDNGTRGFVNFAFVNNADYISHRKMSNTWIEENGRPVLQQQESENIDDLYVEVAKLAVEKLMVQERMNFDKIAKIVPQQLSTSFIEKLANALNQAVDKFINVSEGKKDLISCSIPYAMKAAMEDESVKEGDLVLIVSVAAGIQAGAAIYQF